MYIVNVNNFRPFDLFILLNAAFRNSNIAFSHAALDICLRRAYNALKRTVRQCPSGSYGDAEAAAGYNYKAYFVIPLFICVDGGPQEILRAAACSGKVPVFREAPARQSSADDAPQRLRFICTKAGTRWFRPFDAPVSSSMNSGFRFRFYILGVVIDENADVLQLLDLVGVHRIVP